MSVQLEKKNHNLYLCHTLKIDREVQLLETENEQRHIIFNRQKLQPSERFVTGTQDWIERKHLGQKNKKNHKKSSQVDLFGVDLGACVSDIQLEILYHLPLFQNKSENKLFYYRLEEKTLLSYF